MRLSIDREGQLDAIVDGTTVRLLRQSTLGCVGGGREKSKQQVSGTKNTQTDTPPRGGDTAAHSNARALLSGSILPNKQGLRALAGPWI
jgi:hypothetical protein